MRSFGGGVIREWVGGVYRNKRSGIKEAEVPYKRPSHPLDPVAVRLGRRGAVEVANNQGMKGAVHAPAPGQRPETPLCTDKGHSLGNAGP